jgi:hypothetical protein
LTYRRKSGGGAGSESASRQEKKECDEADSLCQRTSNMCEITEASKESSNLGRALAKGDMIGFKAVHSNGRAADACTPELMGSCSSVSTARSCASMPHFVYPVAHRSISAFFSLIAKSSAAPACDQSLVATTLSILSHRFV